MQTWREQQHVRRVTVTVDEFADLVDKCRSHEHGWVRCRLDNSRKGSCAQFPLRID
jgi:hypothetical protein